MASIRDMVLNNAKKIPGTTEQLIIEQKLNSLFYLPPKIKEESKLIRAVLSKNGYDCERAGLHGSAIIASENEFCYREQVLSLFYKMSQGENVPIGLKRIFEEGNAIHEKWQRLFIRGGLGRINDMDRSRFNDEYDLSYTPDAIITIDGKQYVVEIKSVNTFQFNKMQSHPTGKKQLQLYMYLTGIHKGFVLCDDKNTQNFKVFMYDYDKGIVAPFIDRLEAIQYYKDKFSNEKKLIKRKCKNSTIKRAKECNMCDACYNIGIGRIRLE